MTLTELGTSKAAQIAIAVSAVTVVVTAMASILIAQITRQPIPGEVQTIIAFIIGSGTTLLGHQQGSNATLKAQQSVPEVMQATVNAQSSTTNGVH